MTWVQVLVEGYADVPVMETVLTKRFKLIRGKHFEIHPHRGRGELPQKVYERSKHKQPNSGTLLGELPQKLTGFGKSLQANHWVLVVVDADNTPVDELFSALQSMLQKIAKRPRVLFCIAVEETESWFIADTQAVKKAYPKADIGMLKKIEPDAICGAWEQLQKAIGAPVSNKRLWAEKISPHLNLDAPVSPSFRRLIDGITQELK